MKLALIWCICVALVLQGGCVAVPAVPETRHQAGLGKVAVITTLQAPEIKFEGFAHSKAEGAATGAGVTFLHCAGELAHGGCSGGMCGAFVILWLGICGVASAVGGVVGAVSAPGAAEVRSSEDTLSRAFDIGIIQESIRYQTEAAAAATGVSLLVLTPDRAQSWMQSPDYHALVEAGVDTLLQVMLTEVGTGGQGINAPLLLHMKAHVELMRARDQASLQATDYEFIGSRLTLAEWSANQGAPLLSELETGYRTLGAHIADTFFRLYPFPDRKAHASGILAAAFGLAPVYPRSRGQLTGDRLFGSYFEWTTIDSLLPTLEWQAFPRATDIEAEPDDMGRVTSVRYDLVIARERNNAPAEVVYRREGLPQPRHTLATALQPGTRYFWTVRARFELDGRERVTEWGTNHYMAREQVAAPSIFSYRFKTR